MTYVALLSNIMSVVTTSVELKLSLEKWCKGGEFNVDWNDMNRCTNMFTQTTLFQARCISD